MERGLPQKNSLQNLTCMNTVKKRVITTPLRNQKPNFRENYNTSFEFDKEEGAIKNDFLGPQGGAKCPIGGHL